MQSRHEEESDELEQLDKGMKQNLEQLLAIERLVIKQKSSHFNSFKGWWWGKENQVCDEAVIIQHLPHSQQQKQQQQQQQKQQKQQQHRPQQLLRDRKSKDQEKDQENTEPTNGKAIDFTETTEWKDMKYRLARSTERIKQLEHEIDSYKNDYTKLEQTYNQQRSINQEKQIQAHEKQDQLEEVITELKKKHRAEVEIKEQLERHLEEVVKQSDLKIKEYQQNIQEMQAIIDHNEELEIFNSVSQVNNEKYHQLEMEIERLLVENNDYKNKLDQIKKNANKGNNADRDDNDNIEENDAGNDGDDDHNDDDIQEVKNNEETDRYKSIKDNDCEKQSWSDEDNYQQNEEEIEDYIYQSRHSSLEGEDQRYKKSRHQSTNSRIPILASRSTSTYDFHDRNNDNKNSSNSAQSSHSSAQSNNDYNHNITYNTNNNNDINSFRTDMNQTLIIKNEELNNLLTKNSELEVELKQAMETIDFLRRQHQDDRETIKKLSDSNMLYLDQIKLLSEENTNRTFT